MYVLFECEYNDNVCTGNNTAISSWELILHWTGCTDARCITQGCWPGHYILSSCSELVACDKLLNSLHLAYCVICSFEIHFGLSISTFFAAVQEKKPAFLQCLKAFIYGRAPSAAVNFK